jgi:hypothetical protein
LFCPAPQKTEDRAGSAANGVYLRRDRQIAAIAGPLAERVLDARDLGLL